MVRVGVALAEPQQRFVMSGQRLCVAGEAIFVVPDDLAPVCQSETVKLALHPAQMPMDSIDENRPARTQDALGRCEPRVSPFDPVFLPLRLLPDSEVLAEVVWRVGDDQIDAAFRQCVHPLYTVAYDNAVGLEVHHHNSALGMRRRFGFSSTAASGALAIFLSFAF